MYDVRNIENCRELGRRKPKISIIIPLFNSQQYIEETLASCAAQEYSDFEVIIIDNCSTDQSVNRARAFLKDHGLEWILVSNAHNSGVSFSRNRGLDISSGEYVLFCDADDILHPQTLITLMDVRDRMDADAVFSERYLFIKQFPEICYIDSRKVSVVQVREEQATVTGALIKKDIIADNGLCFEVGMQQGEDTVFALSILANSQRCYRTEVPLYYYRKNISTSLSYNQWNNPKADIERESAILKCLQRYLSISKDRKVWGAYIRAIRKKKNAVKWTIVNFGKKDTSIELPWRYLLESRIEIKKVIYAELGWIYRIEELIFLIPGMESLSIFDLCCKVKLWIKRVKRRF